jgi:tricorn protease
MIGNVSVAIATVLALLAVDPAVAQQAPSSKAALAEPALSPDGREIAFASGGDIWTVPATGGVARLLVSDPATEPLKAGRSGLPMAPSLPSPRRATAPPTSMC